MIKPLIAFGILIALFHLSMSKSVPRKSFNIDYDKKKIDPNEVVAKFIESVMAKMSGEIRTFEIKLAQELLKQVIQYKWNRREKIYQSIGF
jgi:xanthine dehydrogenase iron-sulfur cluster and FAD-binding subunit A